MQFSGRFVIAGASGHFVYEQFARTPPDPSPPFYLYLCLCEPTPPTFHGHSLTLISPEQFLLGGLPTQTRLGCRPRIKSFVICRSTNKSEFPTFRGVDSWVISPCQRQASPHSWDSPSGRARFDPRELILDRSLCQLFKNTLIFLIDNSLWHS